MRTKQALLLIELEALTETAKINPEARPWLAWFLLLCFRESEAVQ